MSYPAPPVVVGIRDEQTSALHYAIDTARRLRRTLRVVHATGSARQPELSYVADDLGRELRHAGRAVLENARQVIAQDEPVVSADYVLEAAPAVRALEDEGETAAMVVVGADDLIWPDRLFGGAVAERLAMHAASPVVVVPERDRPWPLTGGVVVALDAESPASGPLRFAFEQADASEGLLQVLHALPRATERQDAEAARAEVAEVVAGWGEEFPDVRLTMRFPVSYPEAACVHATEHAELVVVGRPERSWRAWGRRRPLAAHVIGDAHCPVAVVPSHYGSR